MVKIVDLPIATSSDLDSNLNFLVVTGTNLSGGFATAKVTLANLEQHYNNTGALTSSGVQALVDSNYIYTKINSSTLNNLTKPTSVAFSNITSKPTTLAGYGINDGLKFSDLKDEDGMASNSALHVPTQQSVKAYVDARILTKDNTDEITEGSTNLYYTNARVTTHVDSDYIAARTTDITSADLNMGSNNIITTGKSLYANMYSTEGNLPSAATYHGMFAHVHGTGKGYFSHGGAWHKLVDETNLSTQVDSAYILARSSAGVDSALILNTITDPKYLRSDVLDNGHSLSLSSTLHADGAITSNADITAFNSASDRTLKENIERIDNALDKVGTLAGYTFNYKGREEKMSGLMADEVEAVLPEVVYEFDGEHKAIRYGNMMGLIVEAINELRTDVEYLREKIESNANTI
tara:strand:+ start:34571 stop:35794 length:1224 start_codon:yes stop_codon:yes gene_type:complete